MAGNWSLPPLPESVQLDLALEPSIPNLGSFLNGFSSDVQSAIRPERVDTGLEYAESVPEDDPDVVELRSQFPTAPGERNRRIAQQIVNPLSPVKVLDPSATVRFKEEAIRRGLLAPDTPLDGRWTPQFESLKYEMGAQSFQDVISGNRAGAMSVESVSKWMQDWLSPSGLFKAAVELDFLPDLGAIGSETASWGDKWRKWWDDPTDGGSLLDAITGPIDDLVLPIVNTALLLTGISEVAAAARVTYGVGRLGLVAEDVYRAGRAAQAFDRLAEMGTVGRALAGSGRYARGLVRAGDVGADIARMREPGFLAAGLMRAGAAESVPGLLASPLAQTGRAMAGWRSLRSVTMAKKGVQLGMRLGFASRLEDTLLPDRQRGSFQLGDIPGVDQVQRVFDYEQSPLTATVGELFFTPYNVWTPGSVVKPVTLNARRALDRIGRVTETRGAAEFAEALDARMGSLLARRPDMAERVEGFRTALKKGGPRAALESFYGSNEIAGLQLTWLQTNAAIDNTVTRQLAGMGLTPGTSDYTSMFHRVRNNLVGQLRDIDPEDMDTIARAMAMNGTTKRRAKLYRQFTNDVLSPEKGESTRALFREWAEAHNAERGNVAKALLDDVQPDDLRSYIERSGIMDAFEPERFTDFMHSTWALSEAQRTGAFVDAKLAPVIDDELGLLFQMPLKQSMAEEIVRVGKRPKAVKAGGSARIDPLISGDIDPMAALTVARRDTVTKQEMRAFEARIKHYERTQELVDFLDANPALIDKVVKPLQAKAVAHLGADASPDVRRIGAKVLNEWVTEISQAGDVGAGKADKVLKALRRAAKYDIYDIAELKAFTRSKLDELDNATAWSDRFGIANFDDSFQRLTLKDKKKALRERMKFTAAEVDPSTVDLPAEVRQLLDDAGYKLVAGVEFLQPHDLLTRVGGIREATEDLVRRTTLSTVDLTEGMPHDLRQAMLVDNPLDRIPGSEGLLDTTAWGQRIQRAAFTTHRLFERPGSAVGDLVRAKYERELLKELQALQARGGNVYGDLTSLESGDFRHILSMVDDKVRNMQEETEAMVARSLGEEGPGGRMLTRVKAMRTPHSVRDLTYRHIMDATGHDPALANAVLRASRRSRDIGSRYRGLAAVEDKLRSEPGVESMFRLPIRSTKAALVGTAGVAGAEAMALLGDDEVQWYDAVPGLLAAVGVNRALAGRLTGERAAALGARLGQDADWFRFTMLGDNLARVRDYFRFALSPFFDLSRYTEGLVTAQAHKLPRLEDGTQARLPVLNSMRSFTRRHGAEAADQTLAEFRAATRGQFDFDGLDSLQKWFQERGLFAYNPTERMATAFGELRMQGVPAEAAKDAAVDIFTYGTTGRSAAELSANFVFFPFSFQKKYLGTVGRFMTDDLTRAVVMTDSLRMYEILNEHYDLSDKLKEHLPALQALQKLNALAFGISPGRFGGINRPYIDAALGAADQVPGLGEALDPIQNLFLPQAIASGGVTTPEVLKEAFRSALPAVNDLEKLWQEALDQGYVVASPNHVTRRTENRRAWDEWNRLRSEADAAARAAGYDGWRSVLADPDLAGARDWMNAKKAEIAQRYPGWEESRADVVRRQVLLREELNTVLNKAAPSVAEASLVQFSNAFEALQDQLTPLGVSFIDNPEDVPPEVFDVLHRAAVGLASAGGGDEFVELYGRYYADLLGPIRREIR